MHSITTLRANNRENLPEILQDFDTTLSQREMQRIQRHSLTVKDVLDHLSSQKYKGQVREVQMFLYAEMHRDEPRLTLLNRLTGNLCMLRSKEHRREVKDYAFRNRVTGI